eukprot:gnl/TRDRNA2_/TRDRNA2_130540_c0_seq1.p1 gnl/TRDRNA2_/TRDRNA2_130540_c0~~gnl/TRDRNA2_/TRDRNA2_130540_c0_seq1.p1  ORF type:complete len:635 (-),score=191.88 gnl/TRDRNA2_/TRDRNA2_130540_c0_seq1:92-1996(-)
MTDAALHAILHPEGDSKLSQVVFRKEPEEIEDDPWAYGEIRHERAVIDLEVKERLAEAKGTRKPRPGDECKGLGGFTPGYKPVVHSKEQLKEWGYPDYDPKFDDPQFYREQWEKERMDPRENANFFLSPEDPEFWHNVARKPYAQALLAQENHWKDRKDTWLRQYQGVKEMNDMREEMGDQLEGCSIETKRLVAPVWKYTVIQYFLKQVADEAKDKDIPFEALIDTEEKRKHLTLMRKEIETAGADAPDRMLKEMEFRSKEHQKVEDEKNKGKKLKLTNVEDLEKCLNAGAKCKQDGIIEWKNENWDEAHKAWRDARHWLGKYEVKDVAKEYPKVVKELKEMHVAVLKNLSQAAIKLQYWKEALETAEEAVALDAEDPKAWFRKACALEGLGKLKEMEDCLDKIDEIAVGHKDRERLNKDVQAKRQKAAVIDDQNQASVKRMLQRGLKKGLFSGDRDEMKLMKSEMAPDGPPSVVDKQVPVHKLVDEKKRKKITNEGAGDLLDDLKNAYSDTGFQEQVEKMAYDVRHDKAEFVAYLRLVALPVQKPVLKKWGFDCSEKGVQEMTLALQDHTRGKDADPALKTKAEEVMRVLYGEQMYEITRGASISEQHRAPKPAAPQKPKKKKDPFGDSDDES